jgi:uncharacterized protein YbaR (Trm112 family)
MPLVDPELLEILRCPETRRPVALAEESLIARLNERREAGRLLNRAGKPVEGKLDGGLIRDDGRVLYPIIDQLPVMLIDEAIPIDDSAD